MEQYDESSASFSGQPPERKQASRVDCEDGLDPPKFAIEVPLTEEEMEQITLAALLKGQTLEEFVSDKIDAASATSRVYSSSRLSFITTDEKIARDQHGLQSGRIIP